MPRHPRDLSGGRFGSLVALHIESAERASAHLRWSCRCDCGRIHYVRSSHLISGKIQSCPACAYRHNRASHQIARAKVAPAKRRRIARQGAAARKAARQ